MTGKELGLLICNHEEASRLTEKYPDIVNSLVITNLLPDKAAVIVDKLEFLKWLCEKSDEFNEFFEKIKEETK